MVEETRPTLGRPSIFSQELVDLICDRISNGESLRKICRDDEMPNFVTIFRWLDKYPAFCKQYTRAREIQADTMAEEILEIADDGKQDVYIDGDGKERVDNEVIARSRLRVDARKWLASKMAPKKYGERVAQEISGPDGGSVEVLSKIERVIVDPGK